MKEEGAAKATEKSTASNEGTKAARLARGFDLLAVLLIVLCAAWGYQLRTIDLDAPLEQSHLGWNQAFYGIIGRNVLRQEPLDAFTLGFGAQDSGAPPAGELQYAGHYPYLHHPPLSFWVAALGIKYIGDDARGVSYPFVLCSVALILLLAALAWGLYGRLAGVVAAGISTVIPMGAWYGRLPSEIGSLFLLLMCAALGSFLMLRRTRSTLWTVPLGFFAAALVLCDWPGLGILAMIGGLALLSPGIRLRTMTTLALACSLTGVYLLLCFARVGIDLDTYLGLWKSLAANRKELPASMTSGQWWQTVMDYWSDLYSWPLLLAAVSFVLMTPFRMRDARLRRNDLIPLGLLAAGFGMILFARGMSVVHDYFSGIALPGLVLAAASWPQWILERPRGRLSPRFVVVGAVIAVLGIAMDAFRVHDAWDELVAVGPSAASRLGPQLQDETGFEDVIITNIGAPRDDIFLHRGRLFEGIDPFLSFTADRRFLFSVRTSEEGAIAHDIAVKSKRPGAAVWYLFDPAYVDGHDEPEQVKALRKGVEPLRLRGSRLLFFLGR